MGFPDKQAEELLVATGRKCCICKELHDVQLHHIDHRKDGGLDDIDNAIPLCTRCHNRVHGSKASGVVTRAYTPGELQGFKDKAIRREKGEPDEPLKVFRVPHIQNPNFTGREELLSELEKSLDSTKTAAVTQAIAGLGGVGKTQLATEYAYRHADDYDVVWWVRSEEPTTLGSDYAALAQKLNLPEKDVREQEVVVTAVREWLEKHEGWLLILDNACEPQDLLKYIPHGGKGHVILTSRNSNWTTLAKSLAVQVFERAESVGFLLERTGENDEAAADKLAEALGDLPLALAQAASYIVETGRSISGYTALYELRRSELIKKGRASEEYTDTIATTWEMSFQEVERLCPAAAELLNICAFLAPDDIPLYIFTDHADELPETLAKAASDELGLDDVVVALKRYSLAEVSDGALSVHRLVQAVVRDRLPEEERKEWAEVGMYALAQAAQSVADDILKCLSLECLFPHISSSVMHGEELGVAPDLVGLLENQVGFYLERRGELADAREWFQRALSGAEQLYGASHPHVATVLNNLGSLLRLSGLLNEARALLERAIHIDRVSLGDDHPAAIRDTNNMGLVLKELGEYEEAKTAFEWALRAGEKEYGKDSPRVAIYLSNLGMTLHALGQLPEALSCLQRALRIDESACEPNQPSVASRLNNIGALLSDMGRLADARAALERCVEIDEAAYGANHPEVAPDLNNLAKVLFQQGHLADAKALFQRALQILITFLPDESYQVSTTRNSLAIVEMAIASGSTGGLGNSQAARRDQPMRHVGRNEACPCGSGKKYKKCCLGKLDGLS